MNLLQSLQSTVWTLQSRTQQLHSWILQFVVTQVQLSQMWRVGLQSWSDDFTVSLWESTVHQSVNTDNKTFKSDKIWLFTMKTDSIHFASQSTWTWAAVAQLVSCSAWAGLSPITRFVVWNLSSSDPHVLPDFDLPEEISLAESVAHFKSHSKHTCIKRFLTADSDDFIFVLFWLDIFVRFRHSAVFIFRSQAQGASKDQWC